MKNLRTLVACAALIGLLVFFGFIAGSEGKPSLDIQSQEGIRPFQVPVPNSEIQEAPKRIRGWRWPQRESVSDPLRKVYLPGFKSPEPYWDTAFGWKKAGCRWNTLSRFLTAIPPCFGSIKRLPYPHGSFGRTGSGDVPGQKRNE